MVDGLAQYELAVRRARLVELGVAEPADLDEELVLLELAERLKRWSRSWWRLAPSEPASIDDELPDVLDVAVQVGDEERSYTLRRADLDRATRAGYTLGTVLDGSGEKHHLLARSKPVTRARLGGRMIDGGDGR